MNILLRNFAHLFPESLKFGPNYFKTMNLLRRTERMNEEEIKLVQKEKLKEILIHAYSTTVYYKELFDKVKFDPYKFNSFDEIESIPFLTKDIVRQRTKDLISNKFLWHKLTKLSTSGSTGEPASFYSYKWESESKEYAFVRNAWNRIGYDGKGVTAVLRGEKFLIDKRNNIYWKTPATYFKDYYSSYDINIHSVPYYFKHMEDRKTKWIMAFPSVLTELCILGKNLKVSAVEYVRGIFLSSEVIHDFQIQIIKQLFPNAKINLIYGHTERACFASTCSCSLGYHFQPEYGYTEFIPTSNNLFEIVATGFNNHAMPLIRYKTGDIVKPNDKYHCVCGLPCATFRNIGGRSQSYIITKSGEKIVETAFIASIHTKTFEKIEQMQFEQFAPGECTLKVKLLGNINDNELLNLKKVILNRLNNDVNLQVLVVDTIPKSKNGKSKLIIQHLE